MKRVMMLTTTAYMSERFNKENIKILNELGYCVDVVANWENGNPISDDILNKFQEWIEGSGNKWYTVPIVRNPLSRTNIKAFFLCKKLIVNRQYDFIHCHTPVAGVVGRVLGHITETKVIYTAHGFHFYKGAPTLNWVVYYSIERFLSRWTDSLVTIDSEDYNIAKRKFHAKHLYRIYGVGIDTNKYNYSEEKRITKRKELCVNDDDIVLFSVGEMNKNKNHQIVIKALGMLKKQGYQRVNSIKYYIAGKGAMKKTLCELAKREEIDDGVIFLGYRSDICSLEQAADLFILPSYREGVSVALMEAIGLGLPALGSRIRGNVDLITENGWLFDPHSVEDVAHVIKNCIDMRCDKKKTIIEANKANLEKYDIRIINNKMKKIYCSV